MIKTVYLVDFGEALVIRGQLDTETKYIDDTKLIISFSKTSFFTNRSKLHYMQQIDINDDIVIAKQNPRTPLNLLFSSEEAAVDTLRYWMIIKTKKKLKSLERMLEYHSSLLTESNPKDFSAKYPELEIGK